jgi:hypothetical protein
MKKSTIAAILVVAALAVAGASYAYISFFQPKSTGLSGPSTLSIYLADSPPANQTLRYLLVNVTSVTLVYEGNVSTTPPRDQFVFDVPASTGTDVNLTSLVNSKLLLGTTSMPAGNVTGIVLDITGAKAFFTSGASTQLTVVADGKLMIHFPFRVLPEGTTTLTLDIQPNEIHYSPGAASVLTPVIRVQAVQSAGGATTTASTTESETT